MMGFSYIATFGRSAWMGVFETLANEILEFALSRDTQVVLKTMRGIEIGTILEPISTICPDHLPRGEILRLVSPSDQSNQTHFTLQAEKLLQDAQELVDRLNFPLLIIDVEMLLDQKVYFSMIRWSEVNLTELAESLIPLHSEPIFFHDLTKTEEPSPSTDSKGCGAENCGSSGGGCGTDSKQKGCTNCSSNAVKTPQELTAYFANLRSQMEANSSRIALHS